MKDRLLLIDTETGGLDPQRHSILSIAALVLRYDGQVLDSMYTLIDEGPNITVEDSALAINGLTVAKVKAEGVSPTRAVAMLHGMLERNGMLREVMVVGHNVKFDYEYVRRLFREAGMADLFGTLFSHRTICTQGGAALLEQAGVLRAGSLSLDALCEYFDVDLDREGGHNALKDANATAALFKHLMRRCREGL